MVLFIIPYGGFEFFKLNFNNKRKIIVEYKGPG